MERNNIMDIIEKLDRISHKLNEISGRLIVASMTNPTVKEAHQMTVDLGNDVDDLINELMD